MTKWTVVCEPEGKNPGMLDKAKAAVGASDGANVGGMVIFIANGTVKEEVSRVAWVRRNSKNPKTSFEKQFKTELDKARTAVNLINEQLASSGELL